MADNKYKLTDDKICTNYGTLYRIQALKDFTYVDAEEEYSVIKGQLGGCIETEDNLSQDGDSWVDYNSEVYDGGKITGHSYVSKSKICNSLITNSKVTNSSFISRSIIHDSLIIDSMLVFSRVELSQVNNSYIEGGLSPFIIENAELLNKIIRSNYISDQEVK